MQGSGEIEREFKGLGAGSLQESKAQIQARPIPKIKSTGTFKLFPRQTEQGVFYIGAYKIGKMIYQSTPVHCSKYGNAKLAAISIKNQLIREHATA